MAPGTAGCVRWQTIYTLLISDYEREKHLPARRSGGQFRGFSSEGMPSAFGTFSSKEKVHTNPGFRKCSSVSVCLRSHFFVVTFFEESNQRTCEILTHESPSTRTGWAFR